MRRARAAWEMLKSSRWMIGRGSPAHADGPTLVRELFHRSGWVYEEKVKG